MKINDIQSVVRGLDPRDTQRKNIEKNRAPSPEQVSPDGDAVSISLSRSITNNYDSEKIAETDQSAELTPQEISDIRARIADGHYDQPETMNALARRLTEFYGR